MGKLDRLLALVHALAEGGEGLTLDEMAERLGVNRRTAERMRDVIREHFELEDRLDEDGRKRFRIRESLRRLYTRPDAAEIAALQAEVDAHRAAGRAARAEPLASLLAKVRSAFDDRERRRIEPDLDALARLQRAIVPAGPAAPVPPETMAAISHAILAATCLEFDYRSEERPEPRWRRVIPYGLVHEPVTYLLGRMPGRDDPPVFYRLDRMSAVKLSNTPGCVPDDFDLDAWLAESFGVWHEVAGAQEEVVLRVLPPAVERARAWRFHPRQQVAEEPDGTLTIRFRAGGHREIAEHLFTWGGEVVIEAPEALKAVMRERLEQAARTITTEPVVLPARQPA